MTKQVHLSIQWSCHMTDFSKTMLTLVSVTAYTHSGGIFYAWWQLQLLISYQGIADPSRGVSPLPALGLDPVNSLWLTKDSPGEPCLGRSCCLLCFHSAPAPECGADRQIKDSVSHIPSFNKCWLTNGQWEKHTKVKCFQSVWPQRKQLLILKPVTNQQEAHSSQRNSSSHKRTFCFLKPKLF